MPLYIPTDPTFDSQELIITIPINLALGHSYYYFRVFSGYLVLGKSKPKSDDEPVTNQDYGYQGPKVDIKSLNWHKINGPFVSIWLHNVPWGGEDTMAAPDARFSDGCLDLIMIKDCPKLSLLMLMNGLNDGSHVKSPHVSYLKVKAFILQPGPRVDDQAKSEEKTLMSYDKPLIKVDQGLATLFASSLDLADLIPIPRD
ncbi:PREDICTED: sphingosine kinase 1-like [Erythranthe guttata]|uniref:sphingosine kinase 1-like n=1 Tax=Erythranthe guttata TaxID=4155 RepID=UPI00064DA1DF|nr:PREDICTED: sphingosine kinase 1-like [Erythranthe guttata]|eukprot:XP_012839265.1 PREDICTED: sphingosine kinase 1-like [Erythranthe guttata]